VIENKKKMSNMTALSMAINALHELEYDISKDTVEGISELEAINEAIEVLMIIREITLLVNNIKECDVNFQFRPKSGDKDE